MHAQVDQWLEFAPHLVTGGGLAPACMTVNEALSLRTFLVGYSLTIADIAVWAQLQSARSGLARSRYCTMYTQLLYSRGQILACPVLW